MLSSDMLVSSFTSLFSSSHNPQPPLVTTRDSILVTTSHSAPHVTTPHSLSTTSDTSAQTTSHTGDNMPTIEPSGTPPTTKDITQEELIDSKLF